MNVQLLVVQWLGVALVGATALLLLKGPQGGAAPAAGSHQPLPDSVEQPAVDRSRVHPWRRWFARMIDLNIFVSLLTMAFGVMPPKTGADFSDFGRLMLFSIVAIPFMVPVEAVLLSSFKTTLGKWIFGIRVTDAHGAPLSFAQAINRSFRVWVQGQWLALPVLTALPALFAYGRLNRTGTTLWDAHCGAVVTHRTWTPARAIGAITATLLVWVSSALITQYSKTPRPPVQATSSAHDDWEKYRIVEEAEGPSAQETSDAPGTVSSEPSGQQRPATPATSESFADGDAAYKRGDYMTALRVFKPLAEQGNAKAQSALGFMYDLGMP